MAAKAKKTVSPKRKAAEPGAGAALSERSKDARKEAFGKATPKRVKAEGQSKPARSQKAAGDAKPSIAKRVIRKVKDTASGAVAMAASVIGKDSGKAKAK